MINNAVVSFVNSSQIHLPHSTQASTNMSLLFILLIYYDIIMSAYVWRYVCFCHKIIYITNTVLQLTFLCIMAFEFYVFILTHLYNVFLLTTLSYHIIGVQHIVSTHSTINGHQSSFMLSLPWKQFVSERTPFHLAVPTGTGQLAQPCGMNEEGPDLQVWFK